jgi:beta-mannanase
MNADWYPWDGVRVSTPGTHDGPARYIAAWRHVHAVFAASGATNVRWVWSPNHRSIPATAWNDASRYYPGDDVVDWIGVDGYDRPSTRPTTFASLFGPVLSTFAGRKPLMVAETATDRHDPARAARFVADVRATVDLGTPHVDAIVWFDTAKRGHDWRIDGDDVVARAFRRLARDPHLAGAR